MNKFHCLYNSEQILSNFIRTSQESKASQKRIDMLRILLHKKIEALDFELDQLQTRFYSSIEDLDMRMEDVESGLASLDSEVQVINVQLSNLAGVVDFLCDNLVRLK